MNQQKLIPFLFASLLACGPSKRMQISIEALERNDAALRAQQAETQRKIEDLSNSLMVLQDRLETLKVAAERQPPPLPQRLRAKPKRIAKHRPAPAEEGSSGESAFGFGEGGGSHLPTLALTNRDIEVLEKKTLGEEPKAGEKKSAAPAADNPEAARAYNEAFKKFEEEKYPEAIRMLEEFVTKYPAHVYSDNAVFWIGESHFRMRDFAKASEQFERVAREFSTGNKVPDALLRAASCYLRLSQPREAQRAFERIVQTYPQSVAAQKAKASLAEISDTGSDQRRM